MELVDVHYSTSTEGRAFKKSSMERHRELFLSENRPEIVRVDCCVLTIPLFWIDIPSSSECIWFSSKFPQLELDYQIELGEIFRPLDLLSGKNLGGRKVFKILVVCNNVNRVHGAFKVVIPVFKSFKDS